MQMLWIGARNGLAQGGQAWPHSLQKRCQPGNVHARLVIVEQRIVERIRIAVAARKGARLLPPQGDDLDRWGAKAAKSSFVLGRCPGVLGDGCGAGDPCSQPGGNAVGAFEAAVHEAQVCLPGRIEIRTLRRRQPVADTRIGAPFVNDLLECGHLFGPGLRTLRGHHNLLIPHQNTCRLRQGSGLADMVCKQGVGRGGWHQDVHPQFGKLFLTVLR